MTRRKLIKRIIGGLVLLLVVIQFIRPARNVSSAPAGPDDFLVRFNMPEPLRRQVQASCYDCHSNNTRYPWYTNVQPVGWWLQYHVDAGRKKLNFSAFGAYSAKKQAHKVDEMIDEISDDAMPLKSYTLIHREARLPEQTSDALIDWLQNLYDSMPSSQSAG